MHCALFNYTRFQPPTVDYVLVYWSEEDCVNVVLYKRRLAPQSTFVHTTLHTKFRTFSTCCFVRNGFGYRCIHQYGYGYRYRR